MTFEDFCQLQLQLVKAEEEEEAWKTRENASFRALVQLKGLIDSVTSDSLMVCT